MGAELGSRWCLRSTCLHKLEEELRCCLPGAEGRTCQLDVAGYSWEYWDCRTPNVIKYGHENNAVYLLFKLIDHFSYRRPIRVVAITTICRHYDFNQLPAAIRQLPNKERRLVSSLKIEILEEWHSVSPPTIPNVGFCSVNQHYLNVLCWTQFVSD